MVSSGEMMWEVVANKTFSTYFAPKKMIIF